MLCRTLMQQVRFDGAAYATCQNSFGHAFDEYSHASLLLLDDASGHEHIAIVRRIARMNAICHARRIARDRIIGRAGMKRALAHCSAGIAATPGSVKAGCSV